MWYPRPYHSLTICIQFLRGPPNGVAVSARAWPFKCIGSHSNGHVESVAKLLQCFSHLRDCGGRR